eukprot:TRINITY_DN1502_c0_g1_i3.p1 TRINITY_DN1502_c0_g1~~TRINITY_DN1502_c0_g1_i3.p1  ORF type:complete len:441 (+),score=61.72 TRINITY_DN1502_c0_g1_i3:13-1335(+)
MSKSVRVAVNLTYPNKSAELKHSPETTVGELRDAAAKALKLDLKEYTLSVVALGEDVQQLGNQKDDAKVTLQEDSTLVVITPVSLLPSRKKPEEKEEVDERFKGLTIENIFVKLAKASGKARNNAFEYLDMYATDVFKTKAFLRLPKKNIIAIMKRDTLNASELEVLEAILAWANSQLKTKGEKATTDSVKETIGDDLIQLIRFTLFSTEDLAAKVTPLGLLSSQQVLELFTYIAQKDIGGTPGPALSTFNHTAREGSGRYGKSGQSMSEGSWKVAKMDGTWSYGAYDNCHSSNSVANTGDLDKVTGFLTGRELAKWKGSGDDYNLPRGSSTTDQCGIYSYPSSEHGIEFQFLKGSNLVRSLRFYSSRLERVSMNIFARKKGSSWSSNLNTGTLPYLSNGGGQKQWIEIKFAKPQLADEFRMEIRSGQCAIHCIQFINGP